jgi:hypothetical protein
MVFPSWVAVFILFYFIMRKFYKTVPKFNFRLQYPGNFRDVRTVCEKRMLRVPSYAGFF